MPCSPPLRAVNSISSKPDAPAPADRGTDRADFAARLKGRLRPLRAVLVRRDTLLQTMREVNATLDPRTVGSWLIARLQDWLPAPSWAVLAYDLDRQLTILAADGLTPDRERALRAVAAWVLNNGHEVAIADLAADPRFGSDGTGTALALPLACRQRTVGVLVALDPAPSAARPSLGTTGPVLRTLLEPAAIALDNALAMRKAEELSVTDDLTRLYNSRYLNLVLRRETKRALRSGRPVSLLFVDLDGFKQVNDNYGHLAGGKALVEAAAVIRACARETDVVARFGGDEFSLILPETACDGAVAVAERVTERLRAHAFLADDGLNVHLTASIGVATLPDVAGSAEDLVRAADEAMYQVKARGKNGIYVAQE